MLRIARGGLLALCGYLAGSASAEDLVEVYDLARAHDSAFQAALLQAQAAVPRAAQAHAALRPNLSATASFFWQRYDPAPSEFDPTGTRADSRIASANLTLRQPLINFAARADVAIADLLQESAQADLAVTVQDFIVRVAQIYFDVLSAQDLLATKRSSKASVGDQLEWAKRRFEAGLGIITDQQDAQARYDLVESEEIAAENDLRVRRLALDRITGHRELVPRTLANTLATTPPVPPGELDDWLRELSGGPTVRRAQLALERAGFDIRRAQADNLPTADLVARLGGNRITGNVSPTSTLIPGRNATGSIGVELNIPLFAGFARQNRIAETLTLREQADQNLQATVRSTTESTERAYFDLKSTLAQVRALEAAERSSRVSLAGTQLGYRAGVRLNLDVLNAQTLLFQTSGDLAKARYEVLMRGLRLEAAAGTLKPASLLAINRLLSP